MKKSKIDNSIPHLYDLQAYQIIGWSADQLGKVKADLSPIVGELMIVTKPDSDERLGYIHRLDKKNVGFFEFSDIIFKSRDQNSNFTLGE